MVADGGHVLVDEASLWPSGQFVTTNLVVTSKFLKAHASTVSDLLKGQIDSNNYIHQDQAAAESAANAELAKLTGKSLDASVVKASFQQITFTNDPIPSSLAADAQHAVKVGLLTPVSNLPGLYNLSPLNALLKTDGQPQVSS
jgi:NitT/TauT family transport system substrate-binding protein